MFIIRPFEPKSEKIPVNQPIKNVWPKFHSATIIRLHRVSDSALIRNHLKFAFLLLSQLYSGTLGVRIEEVYSSVSIYFYDRMQEVLQTYML